MSGWVLRSSTPGNGCIVFMTPMQPSTLPDLSRLQLHRSRLRRKPLQSCRSRKPRKRRLWILNRRSTARSQASPDLISGPGLGASCFLILESSSAPEVDRKPVGCPGIPLDTPFICPPACLFIGSRGISAPFPLFLLKT